MSEPIARRNILRGYRISANKCQIYDRKYFPPKPICDIEGRESRMTPLDYFYQKGELYSAAVINRPTNKFASLDSYISGIIKLEKGVMVPGKITDYNFSETEVIDLIGKKVMPRFRRQYADGKDGLVHYSSLNFSFDDDYYPYQSFVKIQPSESIDKPGIVGYGAYLPKLSIKNEEGGVFGVYERTVPFIDEDSTTFAVEAGKRALIHAALDPIFVKKCFVGTESSPYAVKPIMATVSQVLELGIGYQGGYFSGGIDSQFACKAASDLFIDAAALTIYPVFGGEHVMVIGTDNSQAAPGDPLDYTVGAGATAFIFGKRDVIATLDHYTSYTSDTPDFYRREGEKYPSHGGRFTGEPAFFKHVITAMKRILNESGLTPKDLDYVVTHSPNGGFPRRAASKVGFTKDQIEPGLVVRKIGNLYAGSSLTGLAAVLDVSMPEDRILMVSYGSGAGSDAYIFTVTDKILEKRGRTVPLEDQINHPKREYVNYSTYRKIKDS
jgi:hydroxymethylglutaryl-CoA synthase